MQTNAIKQLVNKFNGSNFQNTPFRNFPLYFLAAMSSSRSDGVTQFVRPSVRSFVRNLFFLLVSLESRVFQGSLRIFQGSFKGVSRVFQGCFKGVSRVFQGSFKGVSRKFQGRFKKVSRVFQRSFKGI